MKEEWKARDAEREALVNKYQQALASNDEAKITRAKNELLTSILPIIAYQASKLRPGDEDFIQDCTIYVASKLKYYTGTHTPGTSALGPNIKTWIHQFWSRDTSQFPVTVKVSQLRAHRKAVKEGKPTEPLPYYDLEPSATQPEEAAPSALDSLIEQEEHLDRVDLVNSLLSALSPEEAEAIRLVHLEGRTHTQAARAMKLTTPKLKQLEETAMRKLKHEDD